MDLISIIIPIYNVEKYLHKCIDSVINQTYKKLEIILVDDGSPDNCPTICDAYAQKDKRIKVIHKNNGGLSDARNCGIAVAKGSLLMFIDSDDYISENMVQLLYDRLITDNSDLAICNMLYVDEKGNELHERNTNMPIVDCILNRRSALSKLTEYKYQYYVIAGSKLYKKSLFNDIKFSKGKIHEDEFIMHHIFDKCKTISCVQKPMYFYVQRENSITSTTISIKKLDAGEAFLDRTMFYLQNDMHENACLAFRSSFNIFFNVYNKLDRKVNNNKKRFNEIRFLIIHTYKLIKQYLPLKFNFLVMLFCINPKIANFLIKIINMKRR